MESRNAHGEWLTKMISDDDNNGCYHGGLQLQRTTAMVTVGSCDGRVVLLAIPTRESSLVILRAHDARCARAAEWSAVDLPG